MDKPVPDISMKDLSELIAEQLAVIKEGMTTKEMCVAAGMLPTQTNLGRVSKKRADMEVLGVLRFAGMKEVATTTGGTRLVPAYELVNREGGEGE